MGRGGCCEGNDTQGIGDDLFDEVNTVLVNRQLKIFCISLCQKRQDSESRIMKRRMRNIVFGKSRVSS